MWLGPSNQLIQVDTGVLTTHLYNPTLGLGAITPYQGIGENQVLGQRYFAYAPGKSVSGITGVPSAANPSGIGGVFMLVTYKSTAQPAPIAYPAPVYWTDETFTTVSGVSTESQFGLSGIAGYLMPNTTSISGLTAAQLQGSQVYIQISGTIFGASAPGSTVAGDWIIGAAGNFLPARVAAGTAPGYRPLGVAITAVASSVADMLLGCDNIY
jgi:hypothetical protein